MCEFPWKLFPEGLLDNIIQKTTGIIRMPIQDGLNGDIEYLWNKYSIKEFSLEDLYEN